MVRKEFIVVDDEKMYNEIAVRLDGEGIHLQQDNDDDIYLSYSSAADLINALTDILSA